MCGVSLYVAESHLAIRPITSTKSSYHVCCSRFCHVVFFFVFLHSTKLSIECLSWKPRWKSPVLLTLYVFTWIFTAYLLEICRIKSAAQLCNACWATSAFHILHYVYFIHSSCVYSILILLFSACVSLLA